MLALLSLLLSVPPALRASNARQEHATARDLEAFARDQARRRQLGEVGFPGERLLALDLPILEVARRDPWSLWSFVIDADTPYDQQRAVVLRLEGFPLPLVGPLHRALIELEREQELHGWGLRQHPLDCLVRPGWLGGVAGSGQPRTILGQPWTPPAERSPYPLTWEEEAAAPWPWRVQRTLERWREAAIPFGMHGGAADRWLDACLALPLETPDDALVFVRASQGSTHWQTRKTLARWRRIALDPRSREAAELVGVRLGETHRLCPDERVREACHLVAEDILRWSPHGRVRLEVAGRLRDLVDRSEAGRGPLPIGAILAACNRAIDSVSGTPRERIYYATGVCDAVDDPPLGRIVEGNDSAIQSHLDDFALWVPAFRASAQHDAGREAILRSELEALAR